MGEYADMALEEQELEDIVSPRHRPPRGRLVDWLEQRNRVALAKRIAALTGFSTVEAYLTLTSARDDLSVARQALERAAATNMWPRPSEVDRPAPWEPTLAWERIRVLAEARAIMLAGVKRLLKKTR